MQEQTTGQVEVTELQDALLDALRKRGDWMTRSELGTAIRSNGRLYPHDIELLARMAAAGIIEAEKRAPEGTYRKEWYYRVKGE